MRINFKLQHFLIFPTETEPVFFARLGVSFRLNSHIFINKQLVQKWKNSRKQISDDHKERWNFNWDFQCNYFAFYWVESLAHEWKQWIVWQSCAYLWCWCLSPVSFRYISNEWGGKCRRRMMWQKRHKSSHTHWNRQHQLQLQLHQIK